MSKVFYLCDGTACGSPKPISCWKAVPPDGIVFVSPQCRRTTNIEHALHFETESNGGGDYYEMMAYIEEVDDV